MRAAGGRLRQRDGFDPYEVELLEVLAEVAGVAIRNARLYEAERERTRLGEVLSHATAALAPPLDRATIAERLAASMQALLQADVAMVGFLDRGGWLRPLAVTGDRCLPEARPLDQVPRRIVDPVARVWRQGVTRACELPADPWLLGLLEDDEPRVDHFVLLPLLADGVPAGAVLGGLRSGMPLDDDRRTSAEALASIGGTALERRALLRQHDDQVRRLEDDLWLAGVELDPTAARDLPDTLRRLQQVLRDVSHIDVDIDVVGCHARLSPTVEQGLYQLVRLVLTAVHRGTAHRSGPEERAIVNIRLEVERRCAHLTVTVSDADERRVDLHDLTAAFEAMGGGLTLDRRTCGLAVHAWLPRHAVPEQEAARHIPSEHEPYGLTSREQEVLAGFVGHLTNREIAERLGIAKDTVRTHVRHVLGKLGVPDRVAARQVALTLGLVAWRDVDRDLAKRSPPASNDTGAATRHGGEVPDTGSEGGEQEPRPTPAWLANT